MPQNLYKEGADLVIAALQKIFPPTDMVIKGDCHKTTVLLRNPGDDPENFTKVEFAHYAGASDSYTQSTVIQDAKVHASGSTTHFSTDRDNPVGTSQDYVRIGEPGRTRVGVEEIQNHFQYVIGSIAQRTGIEVPAVLNAAEQVIKEREAVRSLITRYVQTAPSNHF